MIVEEVFGISRERFKYTREHQIVYARIAVTALIIYSRNTSSLYDYISYKSISSMFNKDHSTITHYLRNSYWIIKGEPGLRDKLKKCCDRLDINYDTFVDYLYTYQSLNPKEKNKMHVK